MNKFDCTEYPSSTSVKSESALDHRSGPTVFTNYSRVTVVCAILMSAFITHETVMLGNVQFVTAMMDVLIHIACML